MALKVDHFRRWCGKLVSLAELIVQQSGTCPIRLFLFLGTYQAYQIRRSLKQATPYFLLRVSTPMEEY